MNLSKKKSSILVKAAQREPYSRSRPQTGEQDHRLPVQREMELNPRTAQMGEGKGQRMENYREEAGKVRGSLAKLT